jgi:hypothetical protein
LIARGRKLRSNARVQQQTVGVEGKHGLHPARSSWRAALRSARPPESRQVFP